MVAKVEDRVIEVERTNGSRFLLTIPGNAKITFAQLNPGAKDSYSSGGPVLRVYEGTAQNQRALFRDISSFRDTSYVIEDIIQEVDEVDVMHSDGKGNMTRATDRKVNTRSERREF